MARVSAGERCPGPRKYRKTRGGASRIRLARALRNAVRAPRKYRRIRDGDSQASGSRVRLETLAGPPKLAQEAGHASRHPTLDGEFSRMGLTQGLQRHTYKDLLMARPASYFS